MLRSPNNLITGGTAAPAPRAKASRVWPSRLSCSATICALLVAAAPLASAATRTVDSFDLGWRFHLGDAPGADKPGFSDSAWRQLDLPHDWSIEGPYDQAAATGGPGGYLPAGIGWYRKTFTLPDSDRGRQVSVQFDGVYEHSTVWINGHEAGSRPYGYTTFRFDLTAFLNFGSAPNVIVVRVDNSQQPNSRWYTGSGIFRHTWLSVADPMHIAPWGVWVTTPDVALDKATIKVTTHLQNGRVASQQETVRVRVLDGDGKDAAEPVTSPASELAAGAEADAYASMVLRSPRLWSPASPSLYTVRTDLVVAGEVIDSTDTTIGVRTAVFDVNRGLLINGEQVKLRGMCACIMMPAQWGPPSPTPSSSAAYACSRRWAATPSAAATTRWPRSSTTSATASGSSSWTRPSTSGPSGNRRSSSATRTSSPTGTSRTWWTWSAATATTPAS